MGTGLPQRFSGSLISGLSDIPEPSGRGMGSSAFPQLLGRHDIAPFAAAYRRDLPQGLDNPGEGSQVAQGPGPGAWGANSQGPLMPPGNIIAGGSRGPPGMHPDVRGRGTFQGYPRGGRSFGQGGRWGADHEEGPRGGDRWQEEGGRGGSRRSFPGEGDRPGGFGRYGGRFQGRGQQARRGFGRWGGGFREQGYEKRQDSWHEHEAGPKKPAVDPAVLERRRASNAARLARQVATLQVSKDLARDDEVVEAYTRIQAESTGASNRPDLRSLYMYPAFAAEEAPMVQASTAVSDDHNQAFEQCLLMYQDAQLGCRSIQSEHGNFLMAL